MKDLNEYNEVVKTEITTKRTNNKKQIATFTNRNPQTNINTQNSLKNYPIEMISPTVREYEMPSLSIFLEKRSS